MSRRKVALSAFALVAIIVVSSASVRADTLDGESIRQLADNKIWAMKWAACMGGTCETFWDWHKDGSICARAIDAAKEDKCADDGTWRLDGNALCWELTWLGAGAGYKSRCVTVEPIDGGKYRTTRVGGIDATFFTFAVVGDSD